MLGVIVTILGTLYIEDWKAEKSRSADRRLLIDAIEEVRRARSFAATAFEAGGDPPWMQLHLRYLYLMNASDALEYAASRTALDDIQTWGSLRSLREGLDGRKGVFSGISKPLLNNQASTDQIEGWRHDLAEFVPLLDHFLDELSHRLKFG